MSGAGLVSIRSPDLGGLLTGIMRPSAAGRVRARVKGAARAASVSTGAGGAVDPDGGSHLANGGEPSSGDCSAGPM